MPGELLVDEPAPRVVRLAISNPAKRNALDHAILDGLSARLRALAALEEPPLCVIVTGSGGMFSAGYDIGDIPDDVFAVEAEKLVAHPFTAALEALDAYPYPTVAALTGHTIGGGLELALACDMRIAHAGIRLGMPPAKLGLVYSHTGVRRFIDAVGVPRTRELFLLGRYVDAQAAAAWGLVNEVVAEDALGDAAVALAAELASMAPLSLAGNKRVIRELLAAEGALAPAVEAELVALRRACFTSQDFKEGVRAFAEKRAPRWRGA